MPRTFTGRLGRTFADTEFSFDVTSPLPPRHPNVVYVLLDDTGFASYGCYGNTVVKTPNIDALAAEGLRYNNFHTTAICSATRASLLTGANHHRAGMGSLIETETGLPNGLGLINPAYGTVAEVLRERGYATYAVGKWHLSAHTSPTGPYDGWPLNKGFDNYYGTLRPMGDQFHPLLTQDNSFVEQPKSSKDGYHFSEDIVDHAIDYVFRQVNSRPEQPFFLYVAFGATHAPFQAPKEYVDRYRGKFDEGWDVLRERWYEQEKKLGVIPADAELTPRNEEVPAWDSLTDDERRFFARQAETFAGFLEHTDAQIGRLVDYLKEIDQFDNTLFIFLSDNGASSEGGRLGKFNQLDESDAPLNRVIKKVPQTDGNPRDFKRGLEHLDEMGGEYSQPHYAAGWANTFNAPFPWYKVWTFEGGTRDALVVSYPALIKDKGGIRSQYAHVSDVTPTVYDVLGTQKPKAIRGVQQEPVTGTSFAYTFDDAQAPSRKREQYYEIWGNRSIYKDGWVAVVNHIVTDGDYDKDVWELYHVAEDFSEAHDVAGKYPEKLRELQDEFLVEAARNGVFPMLKIGGSSSFQGARRGQAKKRTFRGIFKPFFVPETVGIDLDHARSGVTAQISRPHGEEGVIFSSGDRFGGFTLYVKDGRLRYAYNDNVEVHTVSSDVELPLGNVEVGYRFVPSAARASFASGNVEATDTEGEPVAHVTLLVDGSEVGELDLYHLHDLKGWATVIRADLYTEVTPDYEVPFEFGGEIREVTLWQGEHTPDPERDRSLAAHAE